MSPNLKIEKLEEKLLREIIHKGCQDVSFNLSKMLDLPIKASGLVIGLIPIAEISMLTGNPEGIVTAARVALAGDISGYMIFMLTSKSWEICKKLLRPEVPGPEMEPSAFAELANIACSAFITHLSDVVQLAMPFSPPEVMEDMTATVLEGTLVQFSESRELLTIEITLSSRRVQMKGYLFFIPSEHAVQTLTARFFKKASRRKWTR